MDFGELPKRKGSMKRQDPRKKRKGERLSREEKRPCHRSVGMAQPDESVVALDDIDASRIDESGNILEAPVSRDPMIIFTHKDTVHTAKAKVVLREDLQERAEQCLGPWAGNDAEEVLLAKSHSAQTRMLLEQLHDVTVPFILRDFICLATRLSWSYLSLPLSAGDDAVAIFTCEDWLLLCRYDRREDRPVLGFSFMVPKD